jgi:centriolar protein POC1
MSSSSKDGTIKIWDLREGRLLFTLQGHAGAVNCARFSADGHFFASGGADQMVLVWKSNLYGVAAPEIEWGQGKKPLTSGVISSPQDAAIAAARAAAGMSATSTSANKTKTTPKRFAFPHYFLLTMTTFLCTCSC